MCKLCRCDVIIQLVFFSLYHTSCLNYWCSFLQAAVCMCCWNCYEFSFPFHVFPAVSVAFDLSTQNDLPLCVVMATEGIYTACFLSLCIISLRLYFYVPSLIPLLRVLINSFSFSCSMTVWVISRGLRFQELCTSLCVGVGDKLDFARISTTVVVFDPRECIEKSVEAKNTHSVPYMAPLSFSVC